MRTSKITSIKKIGKMHTYDIQVMDNHNFFLANGVLSHNSGKDIAIDFMQELIDTINIELKKQNLDRLCIVYENLSGGETPEVYFSRPRMTKAGGIKYVDGNIDIIHGKLERNDVLFVRECSFLFRLKGSERQNILEILLQALEGRTITKELTGWDGNVIPTKANCAYIGMSRPVKEIQEVVSSSGLLQRGLFYGRELNREDHKKMDDAIANKKIDKEEYRKRFLKLAQYIINFYKSVNPETFRLKDSDFGRKLIKQYKESKRNYLYDELQNVFVQETLNTFINRIDGICVKLSYVNCYARGGDNPDETDVQSALKLLDKIFMHLIVWLENNSIKMSQEELNLVYRASKYFGNENMKIVKRAEVVKFIMRTRGCSYPTALKVVERVLVGPNKLFTCEDDGLLHRN